MKKMYFEVAGKGIVSFDQSEDANNKLTLSVDKQFYYIARTPGRPLFPLYFVDQSDGNKYELFDCYEMGDRMIAVYRRR